MNRLKAELCQSITGIHSFYCILWFWNSHIVGDRSIAFTVLFGDTPESVPIIAIWFVKVQ